MAPTIDVFIKYFAIPRDQAEKSRESISFPLGSTLQDVADWLDSHYEFSLPDPQIMTLLNGRGWTQYPMQFATQIHDGDEICLFPLIGGG